MRITKYVALLLALVLMSGALFACNINNNQPEQTTNPATQGAKPEESKPEESKPQETQPQETQPQETDPQETDPQETQPQETKPQETKPQETKPQETQPQETQPQETQPQQTQPQETKPQETDPVETDPVETDPKEEYVDMSIPEALKSDDGTKVSVFGTVTYINAEWNEQYGNISVTISDKDDNKLYIYRLSTKVELGDIITVTGEMATYNNARQIAQGATAVISGHEDVTITYDKVSIPEAIASEDGRLVEIRGTVKSVDYEWDEGYKNMSVTIVDEHGNELYIYRLSTKVEAGDAVVIKGAVGSYNGAKQIAQGATAEIGSSAETGPVGTDPAETDPIETDPMETDHIVEGIKEEPKEGVVYSFFLYQGNNKQYLYLTGEMSGYYLATAENEAEAAGFLVEKTDGGYKLYCIVRGQKAYLSVISAVGSDGNSHINAVYDAEASSVWTWNTEYNTLTTEVEGEIYYIGTYKTFTTMSPSKLSYAATSFVGQLLAVGTAPDETDPPETDPIETDPIETDPIETDPIETDPLETTEPTETDPLETTEPVETETGEAPSVATSISEIVAADDGTPVVVSGTVVSIDTPWSDEYNNISVVVEDAAGDTILVYRLKTMVNLGDAITITGEVGSYGGSKQIAQGATATIDKAHTTCEDADNNCVCDVCKVTIACNDADADNRCDSCGKDLAGLTSLKFNIVDYATAQGWEIGKDTDLRTNIALDSVITLTVSGGNNSGRIYSDGMRIYSTDDPAGSVTLTAKSGYQIVSVKFITASGTYAFLTLDGSSDDISNVLVEIGAATATFNSVRNGDNGKQVRISAIEIDYKTVA